MALTKYDYYYTLTNFNVLNVSSIKGSLNASQIENRYLLMGVRFQRLLLDNGKLYSQLGFYREEDISNFIGNVRPIPSRLIFSDQSDAMRMNVVRRIDFDLIPQDVKKVSAAFGLSKGSFVHYPTTMNTNEAAGVLLAKTFDFRMQGATDAINYVVDPRSIRDFRSRRTSPQFTSIAAVVPTIGTDPPPSGGGDPGGGGVWKERPEEEGVVSKEPTIGEITATPPSTKGAPARKNLVDEGLKALRKIIR